MNRLLPIFMILFFFGSTNLCLAKNTQIIKIAYITQELKIPSALSNLDTFIQYKGLRGAEIAIIDNNTTGQFTNQNYQLEKIIVPVSANVAELYTQQTSEDIDFIITNLATEQLITLAELNSSKKKLFFDATSTDDALRNENCRDNILHLLPSRAMRADSLAQFMLKKRWKNWFLVTGMTRQDQLYSNAIKRAAKRFGMNIVAEKQWTHTYDARRTAESDVPVFTQGVDYDVLVVADEQGLFGEYFSYRSWIPRPIIGTQGLISTSWHRTHEQWGAVQLQNRFKEQAGRWMEEQDYAAFLAVRAIGEASVRTKTNNLQAIKTYLLSDDFALQGYKGKPLSFRSWNGQLRQPVLLSAARSLVSVAPVEGFLHPVTELDTLGYDRAESACNNQSARNETLLPSPAKQDVEESSNQLQDLINKIKNKMGL